MSLIQEIQTDSYSGMEVNEDERFAAPRKSEEIEIQSEGINLCFIGKHGTEAEDEGFISDTLESFSSNGGMHIFDKLSFRHQSHMPVIQEIDSQDVADLCRESSYDSAYIPTETELLVSSMNVYSSGKLAKEDEASENSLICKCPTSLQFLQHDATSY